MNDGLLSFLLDPANWSASSPDGFPARVLEHLVYTGLGLAVAFAIAFPIGLLIGHTGRFAFVAINAGNAGRALPTLGLLSLVVVFSGLGLLPVVVGLVVLAVPPILTTTYAAVRAVDRTTVDAARGMGMGEIGIVLTVELPIGLPLVFSGLRNATLQVVSTATIAAAVGLGGLGRFLIDGLASQSYPQVFAGALMVGALAVCLDLVLSGVQRLVVSPGVDGRAARRVRRRGAPTTPPIGVPVPSAEPHRPPTPDQERASR